MQISYQSAYRKIHGVETAIIKMYSDLLNAIDNIQVTLDVMIDLSAAFDMVDIPTVLKIFHDDWYKRDSSEMGRILLNSKDYESCY